MRTGEAIAIWRIAECVFYFVIPNEVRDLSSIEKYIKRDSSAGSGLRNDKIVAV
jgi:hypothetical protein